MEHAENPRGAEYDLLQGLECFDFVRLSGLRDKRQPLVMGESVCLRFLPIVLAFLRVAHSFFVTDRYILHILSEAL